MGPARGRLVRPWPRAGRAPPPDHPLRRPASGRPVRSGHAGARVGPAPAHRHPRAPSTRRPRASQRDGAVVRRPVRAGPRPPARAAGRRGPRDVDPRALPHPLARRRRPRPREGDRRLLDLGRRARDERLDLHSSRDRLDRGGRRGRAERGRGRAERAAARRRPLPRAAHARRGGAAGRRRSLGQVRARPRRAADGLRPPGLPRGGPPRPRSAAHGPRAGLAPLRGGRGAGGGGAGRAQGPQARPRARHQRRVLVGGDPRPGRRPGAALHPDVRLRAHGRMGGAHPRAEARGPAHPPDGEVRRTRRRVRSAR